MPTVEPIDKALEIAGIPLYFESFDVLALPGFNISVLYKNEVSVYEVEKQNFTFELSTSNVQKFKVKENLEFYMEDSVYKHKFKIDRNPEHDLTGWSKLYANYMSRIEC